MRYMIISYLRKANGQLDESMTLGRRLRNRDIQTAAVILDFRDLKVVKASMDGHTVAKDFDRIMGFYHQFYPHVIDRLFRENGYQLSKEPPATDKDPVSELSVDGVERHAE